MANETQQAAQAQKKNQSTLDDAAKRQAEQDEYDRKRNEDPAQLAKDGDPVHFHGTVAKLVQRTDADGNETWEEVMSDNLYPGEKLKRVEDANAALSQDEKARREAARDQSGVTGDQKK